MPPKTNVFWTSPTPVRAGRGSVSTGCGKMIFCLENWGAAATFEAAAWLTTFPCMTTTAHIITTLRTHRHILASFGVSNIGLFGSYLHNTQTSRSDIDILIDFEPNKETFDNYMAVYDYFENIFKGEKIEIVTKNGLSKHIGPQILKDVFYV